MFVLQELLLYLEGEYGETGGAVLIFLPGLADITELYEILTSDQRFYNKHKYVMQMQQYRSNYIHVPNLNCLAFFYVWHLHFQFFLRKLPGGNPNFHIRAQAFQRDLAFRVKYLCNSTLCIKKGVKCIFYENRIFKQTHDISSST